MRKLFLSLFLLLLWVGWAGAVTYYVSPSGSDTNCDGVHSAHDPGSGGLPRACAFATAAKVNTTIGSTPLGNDGQILFEGGVTHTLSGGALALTNANITAASGHPVIVDSYGGSNATISITGNTWVFGKSMVVWRGSYITFQNLNVSSVGPVFDIGGNQGSPYDQATNITIKSCTVTVTGTGAPTAAINVLDASNITIDTVTLVGPGSTNANYYGILVEEGVSGATSSSVAITNATVHEFDYGIGFEEVTGGIISNPTVTNSTVYNGKSYGIVAFSAHGLTVSGSTVHDVTSGAGIGFTSGCVGGTASNNTVYNIAGDASSGIYSALSSGITVANNTVYSVTGGLAADAQGIVFDAGVTNSTISRNYVHDTNGSGIWLGIGYEGGNGHPVSGNTVSYNLLVNTAQHATVTGCLNVGANSTSDMVNNTVANNTCYSNTYDTYLPISLSMTYSDGSVIENNIFYNAVTGAYLPYILNTNTNLTMNYNNYFYPVTFKGAWAGVDKTSYSQWKLASATGCIGSTQCEANGITSDPQFVSTGTDFHLSSATNVATYSGVSLGLTTDKDGKPVHVPPSRGAYEYPWTVLSGVFKGVLGAGTAACDLVTDNEASPDDAQAVGTAAGNQYRYGSFTASATGSVRTACIWMVKDTGTSYSTTTLSLCTDNAGVPGSCTDSTDSPYNNNLLSTSVYNKICFAFAGFSVTSSGTYYVQARTNLAGAGYGVWWSRKGGLSFITGYGPGGGSWTPQCTLGGTPCQLNMRVTTCVESTP